LEQLAAYFATKFPNSLHLLEKFVPTLIALIALIITAWIQVGQVRTAKTKLKLDLFDRRGGIFDVLDEINRAYNGAKDDEWVSKYLSKMAEATLKLHRLRLLFPIGIGNRVDEIVEAWHDFTTLKAEGESLTKPSEQWSEHVKTLRALWEKIGEKNKRLRADVEGFIRVDWEG
jgi:hypothetical protein